MRHVGDSHEHGAQVCLDLFALRLQLGDLRPQLAAFLNKGLFFRGVLLLTSDLGNFVGPLLKRLRFLD